MNFHRSLENVPIFTVFAFVLFEHQTFISRIGSLPIMINMMNNSISSILDGIPSNRKKRHMNRNREEAEEKNATKHQNGRLIQCEIDKV